jgi:DNA-binding PadR family transcriptional regulator
MREWTEVAFSSIYYILRKLEKKKLIRSQINNVPGRGPARKVYQVTEAGSKAWTEATLKALSTPVGGSDPFLLGLAGLPAFSGEQAAAALRLYRRNLAQRRDLIRDRWQAAGEHLPLFLEGMFDFSVSMLEARMDWVGGFLAKIEVGEGESDS